MLVFVLEGMKKKWEDLLFTLIISIALSADWTNLHANTSLRTDSRQWALRKKEWEISTFLLFRSVRSEVSEVKSKAPQVEVRSPAWTQRAHLKEAEGLESVQKRVCSALLAPAAPSSLPIASLTWRSDLQGPCVTHSINISTTNQQHRKYTGNTALSIFESATKDNDFYLCANNILFHF